MIKIINKFIFFFLLIFILISCDSNSFKSKEFIYPDKLCKKTLYTIDNGYRNGEGAFILLKNNQLAYIYTCFSGTKDNSYSDICMIKSINESKTKWSEPKILIYNNAVENIMSVSAIRMKNGSILIQYLKKNSCNDLVIARRFSYDELKTFSKEYILDVGDGYNVVNNDRIINVNHNIYVPISKHFCINGKFIYNGKILLAITSEKNVKKIIQIPTNDSNITFQEPGIFHILHTKKMIVWLRNSSTNIMFSKSQDWGMHFNKPEKGILQVVPYSPSSIKVYNNSDVFIIYNKYTKNNKENKRAPLVLSILDASLKNIKKEYIIENNSSLDYEYISMYKDSNDLVIAYYVQNKNNFILKILKLKGLVK